MNCRGCGDACPAGARFCPSCGHSLAGPAAGAEAKAPAQQAYREGVEQERKQITAMFIDIVGSMDVAERVGDEPWRDILHQFLATTSGAVVNLAAPSINSPGMGSWRSSGLRWPRRIMPGRPV